MSNDITYLIFAMFLFPLWVLILREHLRPWILEHRKFGMLLTAIVLGCVTDLFILFFIGLSGGHISTHNFFILMIPSFGFWLVATSIDGIIPPRNR